MNLFSTYSAVFFLLLLSKYNLLCLDSNEYRDPQVISDDDLCEGRSIDCEVELDVPAACVDTASSTSHSPIVFFLHGAGGSIDGFSQNSGVHENNMIGIYPNGDCNGWNTGPKPCNQCEWDDFSCTEDPNEGEFVAKIISKVRGLGALGNVYVRGNSNGAALALRLAVNSGEELPISGIIARVTQLLASPERSGPGELNYNQPINSNPPVSVLSISGTADGLIPYEGGTSSVFGGNENFYFMSNQESNEAWALHNECDLTPEIQTVSATVGSMTTTADYFQYPNCIEGTYVEHYKVYDAGHNAGGATLDGVNQRDIVFNFIRKVEGGVGGNQPSLSPVVYSPTPAPLLPECEDDDTWHGKFNEAHTCDFVALDPDVRCNWEDDDEITAMIACPVACDTCANHPPSSSPVVYSPTPAPLLPECEDDDTWQGKFNQAHNCDFVALAPYGRCNWEDDDGITAMVACPVACDTCSR